MTDETLLGGVNTNTDGATDEGNTNQTTEPTAEGNATDPQAQTQTQEPIQYDFTEAIGENPIDEARATEFSELLRAANVPQEHANAIAAYGIKYAQDAVAAMQQQRVETEQQWGQQTREALGKDLDATVQKAGVAVERLEKDIPNIRELLNESGVGNRVEFVKAFAMLGELLSEDSGHGTTSSTAQTKSIYDNTDFSKY